jgi:spermidine/putrescine-binding protein
MKVDNQTWRVQRGTNRTITAAYRMFSDDLSGTYAQLDVGHANFTGGELTNLFQSHEIVLAMGWPLNTEQLRKLKFPIGETIPKENTTGWIDHLMITSASKNKDLATDFLAYMIEAKTQKLVSDVTQYTPANPDSAEYLSDEQKRSLHLDDPEAFLQQVADRWRHQRR